MFSRINWHIGPADKQRNYSVSPLSGERGQYPAALPISLFTVVPFLLFSPSGRRSIGGASLFIAPPKENWLPARPPLPANHLSSSFHDTPPCIMYRFQLVYVHRSIDRYLLSCSFLSPLIAVFFFFFLVTSFW